MEDITKYIGLLGFVPFVLLILYIFRVIFMTTTKEEFGNFIKFMFFLAVLLGGLIWGITTLGRLL